MSGYCKSTSSEHEEPRKGQSWRSAGRSEEHTSELQSQSNLVCRLLLEKKNPTCLRPVAHAARDWLDTITSTPRSSRTGGSVPVTADVFSCSATQSITGSTRSVPKDLSS